jgi:hypothetical protein
MKQIFISFMIGAMVIIIAACDRQEMHDIMYGPLKVPIRMLLWVVIFAVGWWIWKKIQKYR